MVSGVNLDSRDRQVNQDLKVLWDSQVQQELKEPLDKREQLVFLVPMDSQELRDLKGTKVSLELLDLLDHKVMQDPKETLDSQAHQAKWARQVMLELQETLVSRDQVVSQVCKDNKVRCVALQKNICHNQ